MWESDNRALNLELSVLCSNADSGWSAEGMSVKRFGDPWSFWGFMLAGRHKAKEALVFGLNKLNLQSILNLFQDLGHLLETEQIFC